MISTKKKFEPFECIVGIILTIWAGIIIFPFFNVIALSLATEKEYLLTPYLFFPTHPTLENYVRLLKDGKILTGYRTTMLYEVFGVPYNLFLTFSVAYALSRPAFPGKKFFMVLILFTMYFSGGIVPTYLLIRNLRLTNTIWAVIIPYGVNTFYMLIVRNYMISLPPSLSESARIDGAGEWTVMFRIVIPLCKPIIATFALFYAVDRWNEWFNAMIYTRNIEIMPLQLVLRSIIITADFGKNQASSNAVNTLMFSKGLKAAAVIITMAPIMLAYPFLQRYFVKGMTIGAVKA
jgi:putative aldouronate transport system permease protein